MEDGEEEEAVGGAKAADEVKAADEAKVEDEVKDVDEVKDAVAAEVAVEETGVLVGEKGVAVGEDPRTLPSTLWTRLHFPHYRSDSTIRRSIGC